MEKAQLDTRSGHTLPQVAPRPLVQVFVGWVVGVPRALLRGLLLVTDPLQVHLCIPPEKLFKVAVENTFDDLENSLAVISIKPLSGRPDQGIPTAQFREKFALYAVQLFG